MTKPQPKTTAKKRCSPYCNCEKCARIYVMDETVMPDGRPLFAWRSELEMLRAREVMANENLKAAHDLARVAGIAKIYREENPYNLEMVIRVLFNPSKIDPFSSIKIQ